MQVKGRDHPPYYLPLSVGAKICIFSSKFSSEMSKNGFSYQSITQLNLYVSSS